MQYARTGILKSLLVAAGLCLLSGGGASADQNDVRLDRLFESLHGNIDETAARVTEANIWLAWIEHHDPAVELLMRNGIAAMNRGDQRGALEDFDQVVKIAPDFAEGWNKRATVLYLLGDYRDSLADIDRTLELEPRHFGALSGRGLIYLALEEPDRALEALEAAIAVNPYMPGAKAKAEALHKMLEGQRI